MPRSSGRRSAPNASTSSMPLTPPLTEQGSGSSGASGSNTTCLHSAEVGGVLTVQPCDTDFVYGVEHLYGTLPLDKPFWINHTHLNDDRRGCNGMTLHYSSPEKSRLSRDHTDLQDSVRQSVWAKVRELAPSGLASQVLPQVVFDESSEGQSIDLIFPQTKEGAEAMVAFSTDHEYLDVEKISRNQWRTFQYVCSTNSLGGKIMPFDVHRLPLDLVDCTDLFEGLARMVSPVGTLLSIGRVVMKSSEWGVEGVGTGVTRGYVRLSAKAMSLSFEEFAHLLPTRFLWCGTAHSLFYSGHFQHKEGVVSPDYGVLLGHDAEDGVGGVGGIEEGGDHGGGEDDVDHANGVGDGGGDQDDGGEGVRTPSVTPALEGSSNHHGNNNDAALSSSSPLAAKRRRTSRN